MSEHTKTPWAWCDHGVGELVVYSPDTDNAICTFDDDDTFWAWPDRYVTGGEAEANARHIVHCVNNHERLVKALRDCEEVLSYVAKKSGLTHSDAEGVATEAHALIAALEAEKGGEL